MYFEHIIHYYLIQNELNIISLHLINSLKTKQ